jgi:hypothetical protein
MTTLLFTRCPTLVSRAIRWVTGSATSHVTIGGVELAGADVVLQATTGGVQVTPRAALLAENDLVEEYEVLGPCDVRRGVLELGERYNYVGLFGYLFVQIARWFGRKIKNPLSDPHAVVCSEFALTLGIAALGDLPPRDSTPQDLLEACRGRPDAFRRLA